jgi:hypothetical protein
MDSNKNLTINGTLNGYIIGATNKDANYKSNKFIPAVVEDGVMEIGKYIDFHEYADASSEAHDYKVRLESNNGRLVTSGSMIVKGYLDATSITMSGKDVAFRDHTHPVIDYDVLWNGNLNKKTGTKTTTELKMNWLTVVTIPTAMSSANKYNHTIVMSRNTYLIQKDDYLKASFSFKDVKGNILRTYTLEHKFGGTSDQVYIEDDVLWTPYLTDYELIFEDLPYDSSGKIYVDCSELAIYHDYISDVI